jgi:tetratricopeptide (TPR) repeat protein
MNDTLDYIDTYFTGKLTDEEKAAFEERCVSDPVFAEDVAFYISARADLKQTVYEQKRKEFDALAVELKSAKQNSWRGPVRKMLPYISSVAAILLLFFAWQFIFKNPSNKNQKELANAYIHQNMDRLGVTMGAASKDSLQLGIAAFNNKDYKGAEAIFQALTEDANVGSEAIKNLGIAYLVTNKYDNAIVQFEKLAQMDLYANPGLFYKAVTLMKRGNKGDEDNVKQLLEEVVKRDLAGSKTAKEWLLNNKW